MSSIATIKETSENVVCDARGCGTHLFTITNTSGEDLRIGFQVVTDKPALNEWFQTEGEAERFISAGACDQVSVRVEIPPDTPHGRLTFRLLAYSAIKGRADEDYSEGPTISFERCELETPVVEAMPPPKKPFAWWIAAVAGIVLLISAGTIAFLVNSDPTVPDVAHLTVDEASTVIEKAGFTLGEIKSESRTLRNIPVMVARSEPEAGQIADPGSVIDLITVAASVVPNVRGVHLRVADRRLRQAGLKRGRVSASPVPDVNRGAIAKSDPPEGTRVARGSTIDLFANM